MNLITTVFLINLVQHTWQTTFAFKRSRCINPQSDYPSRGYPGHEFCANTMSPYSIGPNYEDTRHYDFIKQNDGLDDRPDDAPRQTEENRKVLILISKKLYNKMAKKALHKYDNDKSDGKSILFLPTEALFGAKVLYKIKKNYINSEY